MIEEYQIRILPEQAASEEGIKRYLSKEKGIDVRTLNQVRVLKRSIDARQRTIYVNLKVRAYINEFAQDDQYIHTEYPDVSSRPCVVVVGEGPGGLFASLRLIELGYRPVVLERGKDVRERKKDLSNITKTQKVDAESNYCFGEGGAGAYSDGKLYTRSKKRGSVDKILNVFCQHGANTNILADAHPHIGTDKLPRVIENMRNTILQCGGEVHFQTKMTSFIIDGDKVIGVEAVNLQTGAEETYRGPVILATGHSARDVYRYLAASRIEIEAKGIAVGVRLEHPAHLIDQIQYHNKNGRGKYLPAAEYSFVTQVDGRGVYSFCMCPGGFVIPAATGPQQLVVNGMSPSNRGTAWSNSGMVVETHPEDVASFVQEHQAILQSDASLSSSSEEEVLSPDSPLTMMHFQQIVEKQCWQQGNMKQTAPAQRMADFVNNRLSYDLPKSSYAPGLISSPLHFWMPSFVSKRLQEGFKTFGKNAHGFLTNEATLIAMETRTSSPVRILRDRDTLQHVRLQGLFPCGEGAGYAGGIVSAGVDGERCAEMCAEYLKKLE
ncbi:MULTISPECIES: NAD(P)/FAD-dependent oxidoreductase [Prevotellaceae]|uniref:NAD(P)/FAD-dependent oxidoreductase n=1 Tax=Segatella intestinalis TaxID=3035284 RepID=UPI0023EB5A79|nr:FAD-binding protein [Prevotella sp. B2-R-102]MDF4242259.1 FAD-binding protein [Prevotella sp. B2-R-102]